MRRRLVTCAKVGCRHLKCTEMERRFDRFRYGGPYYAFMCLVADPTGSECCQEWFESHAIPGSCPYVTEYAVSQGEDDAEQASV